MLLMCNCTSLWIKAKPTFKWSAIDVTLKDKKDKLIPLWDGLHHYPVSEQML